MERLLNGFRYLGIYLGICEVEHFIMSQSKDTSRKLDKRALGEAIKAFYREKSSSDCNDIGKIVAAITAYLDRIEREN